MAAAALVADVIVAGGGDGASVDETLAAVDKMLTARREGAAQDRNHYELLIAGISETKGPVQAVFSSLAYGGQSAFTLYFLPVMYAGPHLTPAEVASLGVPPGAGDSGLAGWGEALIELARQHADIAPAQPDQPPHYGIGGQLNLTVVSAAGACTTRLLTWPDKVGEKIDPFRQERVAA